MGRYECPICRKLICRYSGLYNHKLVEHKEFTDHEFVKKFRKLNDIPQCTIPGCESVVDIDYYHLVFYSICSMHRSEYKGRSIGGHISHLRNDNKLRCPICSNSFTNLWNHFSKVHLNELSDKGFLVRYLNLNEIPICKAPGCSNECQIVYAKYKFSEYCSRSCISRVNRIKLCDWELNNKELAYNIRSQNGRNGILKLCSTRRSNQELNIFNRIKALINLEVYSNLRICGYKPDIVISELKLIIEIDGSHIHKDFNKEISRDKILNKQGYKIRRLDSCYSQRLTDSQLLYLILLESTLNVPYYERIPFDQIFNWKSDIYQVGPKFLLTWG